MARIARSENGVTRVTAASLTVVQGLAAEEAGCVTYWRTSGILDLERLGLGWAAEGLDPDQLPAPPSRQAALRRAFNDLARHRALVRPLEGRRGAWALVLETVRGDDLSYDVELRAWLGEEVGDAAAPLVVEPADHPEAPALRARFERALGEVTAADVGGWLSGLVYANDAVALRDSGGVYFVPRHRMMAWRGAARALAASGASRVLMIPALPNDEVVAAVVDAVTSEAEAECARLEEEVMRDGEDALGKRALASRLERTDAAKEKLARYEALLGTKLDVVRERLLRARGAVAAALLSSGGEEGVL